MDVYEEYVKFYELINNQFEIKDKEKFENEFHLFLGQLNNPIIDNEKLRKEFFTLLLNNVIEEKVIEYLNGVV